MTARTSQADTTKTTAAENPALNKETLLGAYRTMLTGRALDQKMLRMLRQGKSYFHIGGMGHEATQVAATVALTKGKDWAFPYYRGINICLGLGMTPQEVIAGFLGKGDDPSSGGRQMPQHWGHKKLNIPTQSSPTGSQYLQAVGNALASVRNWHKDNAADKLPDYEVTIVSSGEGTASQGDLHEAFNWAAREKAPVIFLIENNGYAISVPIAEQTAGGSVANFGRGYEGMAVERVDGTDFFETHEAFERAVLRARRGDGPTLIEADVVRLLPHSSSDDQKKYRPAAELEADLARDPMPKMRAALISRGFLDDAGADALDKDVLDAVNAAADAAEAMANPAAGTAEDWVFSGQAEPAYTAPVVADDAGETVLVDAINRALDEELGHNPDMLVFGEDVAGNKGGVFTATRGLTDKHGKDRVFNSQLAESSIVGVAIGMAMRGYKLVPEIQFGDYIWTAMNQIRNELATVRYRSNNAFKAPVVLRVPIGGYIHGGLCHSQNIESFFAHIPGLKIAMPSTALDAYGLLKAAIRGDDPVLFLEHKSLYRQNFAKSKLPAGDDWVLPFGKANVRRTGEDLTIVTYGAMVQKALQSAARLEDEGFSVEVVDLRSLNPVDWDTIFASVKKTGKVLVAYEDCRFVGYGAEIAAEITEKCFEHLDGPVRRLAGKDTPIPFHWDLEDVILPQTDDVLKAARDLLAY